MPELEDMGWNVPKGFLIAKNCLRPQSAPLMKIYSFLGIRNWREEAIIKCSQNRPIDFIMSLELVF